MKKRLKEIMSIQSYSHNNGRMMKFLKGKLKEMNIKYYVHSGNLYAIKGKAEIYPCVVSHTDTVHKILKDFHVIENNGYMFAYSDFKQVGIGGDDKVGIFICLELLRVLPVLKVVFFRDEETGCEGSKLADDVFFKNVGYVLQADRRNSHDVTESISGMDMINESFKGTISSLMTKYGRSYVDGMMTDVEALAKKYEVCMFNCSCGYYDPHTQGEYIVINEVFNTLSFMYECIVALGNTIHECKHESKYNFADLYDYKDWNRFNFNTWKYGRPVKGAKTCPNCGGSDTETDFSINEDYFCWTCAEYFSVLGRQWDKQNRLIF